MLIIQWSAEDVQDIAKENDIFISYYDAGEVLNILELNYDPEQGMNNHIILDAVKEYTEYSKDIEDNVKIFKPEKD